MTSWIVIALGAALLWAGLAFAGKAARWSVLPLASAFALAMAGYAWQGSPALPSAPVVRTVNMDGFGEVIDQPLGGLTNRYGTAARWVALSEAMQRQGKLSDAARVLYGGTINYPDNADMWVAYGTALATASNGKISPAARLAFERAATLAPGHPGPELFLGLAAAQDNDFDEARSIWNRLLSRSPPNAPYRADIESRLKMIDAIESGAVQATAGRSTN